MNIETNRSSALLRLLSLSVATFGLVACDLDMKDLGNETDTAGSTAGGSDDGASPGGPCTPGDQQPANDGCNTCECSEDGTWGCTEIGCDPTGGDPTAGGSTEGGSTGAAECTPGDMMPADDGCNTCTCGDDGLWACTLLGCVDPAVTVCDGTEPADAVVIGAAAVVGDALVVTVSYSGGCAVHDFQYCWTGEFLESFPVQVPTSISHDGHDDPCDAFPSEELTFDLLPLRAAYEAGYGVGPATIEINLDGWMGSIPYAW
jgi:hypothetical protein